MSSLAYHKAQPAVRTVGGLSTLTEEGSDVPSTLGVQHHFRDARPRRPRKNRRSIGWDPTLDIYDDTFAFKDSSGTAATGMQPPATAEPTTNVTLTNRRSSILFAQPAQRKSAFSNGSHNATNESPKRKHISSAHSAMRNVLASPSATTRLDAVPEPTLEIKKEPRRRTIYIPSDDTTILSIHPGAHSGRESVRPRRPRQSDVFLDLATQTVDVPHAAERRSTAAAKPRKAPRMSLATAPRRAPLQQSARIMQPSAFTYDRLGSGDGKENVPPGAEIKSEKVYNEKTADINLTQPTKSPTRVLPTQPRSRPRLSFAMDAGESIRSSVQPSSPQALRQPLHSATQGTCAQDRNSSVNSAAPGRGSSIFQSSTFSRPSVPSLAGLNRPPAAYPVLSEDVSRPELYEEGWLSHQEIALTECVNSLLESSKTSPTATGSQSIRKGLMDLHESDTTSLLHRRLQASLRFGALSVSADTLSQVARYKDDLQQRQRFLDLWMKTYNLDALQSAAEVVIGREIPQHARISGSPASHSCTCLSHRRKRLDRFLRTFLVGNEDGPRTRVGHRMSMLPAAHDASSDDIGSQAWAWRRTIVRSLMIILLLDKAAQSSNLERCLFQASSSLKSSASVVQALGSLLLPSIGNIARVLEHLSYHVSHVQHPLEECVYRIDNLAGDLRDGVFLTRLVETLLYPSTTMGPGSGVLSQHLKYPCVSRVQKIHNVEIVLSALRALKDTNAMLGSVSADDIVDGHREKTVGLLWGLVSHWGLSTLVDFRWVERELVRLDKEWSSKQRSTATADGLDDAGTAELLGSSDLERYTTLLKLWASRAARLHGFDVHNLSTSFADGKAYRAIVSEYVDCLPATPDKALDASTATMAKGSTRSNASTLRARSVTSDVLTRLGCSRTFIALFENSSTIPTSQTTIPYLAFLASRLLPATLPHFAATTIQRAWRRRHARFEITRRVRLAILARECQSVVLAQQRIVEAAMTIQRWWRHTEAYWLRPREAHRS